MSTEIFLNHRFSCLIWYEQNFVVNAAEAQIKERLWTDDGALTLLGEQLEDLDMFFTIVFTAELLVNAYAHWFKWEPFTHDCVHCITFDCFTLKRK